MQAPDGCFFTLFPSAQFIRRFRGNTRTWRAANLESRSGIYGVFATDVSTRFYAISFHFVPFGAKKSFEGESEKVKILSTLALKPHLFSQREFERMEKTLGIFQVQFSLRPKTSHRTRVEKQVEAFTLHWPGD